MSKKAIMKNASPRHRSRHRKSLGYEKKIVVILVGSSVLALATSRAQDAKFAADSLKYSHDSYAKVHLVAIANLDFGNGGTVEFKYDRYPNGGPERIQAGNGEEFAWK